MITTTRKVFFFKSGDTVINRMNPDGTGITTPIAVSNSQANSMRVDTASGKIYWPEESPPANRIRSANLNGTSPLTVGATTAQTFHIGLDTVSQIVYYVNGTNIRKVNFNGSGDTLFFNATPRFPGALAIDGVNGKIYYATSGGTSIRRIDDNGANDVQIIAAVDAGGPVTGLDIDVANNKIYWAVFSQASGRIKQANLDGSNPTDLLTGLNEPVGIVLTDADITAPAIPNISSPQNATYVNSSRPLISGTGEVGSTITVFSDALSVGTTTVDAGGLWSLTPSVDLADGNRILTAQASDSFLNTSSLSSAITVTVDTVPPSTATITDPLNGTSTKDSTPSLSGTSDAGSTVKIFFDGVLDGATAATAGGLWVYTPASALSEGLHQVTALAFDIANNQAVASAAIALTIDSKAPAAPAINTPSPNERVKNLAGLKGSAEPGSTVVLTINGVQIGSAVADIGGNWNAILASPLGLGDYTIQVVAVDALGNVSLTSQIAVSVVTCIEVSRTDVKDTLTKNTKILSQLMKASISFNKQAAKKLKKCRLISAADKTRLQQSFALIQRKVKAAALPKSEFVCDPVPASCTNKSITKVLKDLLKLISSAEKLAGKGVISNACAKFNTAKSSQIFTEASAAKTETALALGKFGNSVIQCN